MPLYYLNEAVLDLPARPFVDKTVHGLESKLSSGNTLGVLVHRRAVAGSSLSSLVDESLAENERRLSGFATEGRRELCVDGVPTIALCVRWRQGQRENVQLQAYALVGEVLMVFAVSASEEDQAACEETFATLLDTLTWRTE